MLLSIVVPVFEEERNIDAFLAHALPILREQGEYELIFVLDPGRDATEAKLRAACARDSRIRWLRLSRRFGQPMATLAGLERTRGDVVAVMDVDLQDPPELLPRMLEKWREGFEVVAARRRSRSGESPVKRLVASLGYRLIRSLADVEIPRDTGDFRLMSRRVVDILLSLKESHGFLRGMVAYVGFRQTSIEFDRPARHAGEGHYSRHFGSIRIGVNGIVCFSNRLLSLSSWFGFAIAGAAFVAGLAYLFAKLSGVPFPMGNPTIVIITLFLGGVQLISVGILGEYIGRIYDEVKGRPKVIVDEAHGFEERPARVAAKPAKTRSCRRAA